jgi:hypothetical protein
VAATANIAKDWTKSYRFLGHTDITTKGHRVADKRSFICSSEMLISSLVKIKIHDQGQPLIEGAKKKLAQSLISDAKISRLSSGGRGQTSSQC